MATFFRHGKGGRVLVGSTSYFDRINRVTRDQGMSAAVATADTTVHGSTDQTFIAGHRTAGVNLGGLVDCSTERLDEVRFRDVLGSTAISAVLYLPEGESTGRRASFLFGGVNKYDVSSPAKDVIAWTAEMGNRTGDINGSKDRGGVVVYRSTNRTSTNAGASNDNAAASTSGYAFAIAIDGTLAGATVLKLQHSSNGSAWSDAQTLTASTTESWKIGVSTADLKRYVRGTATTVPSTGSADFTVAVARR